MQLRIHSHYVAHFGHAPQLIVRAPGRVNLIGEHTDYNAGFVFYLRPLIWSHLYPASPRTDRRVRVFAADFNKVTNFAMVRIERRRLRPWSNYIGAWCGHCKQPVM
jgi:galactokinase